MQVIVVLQVAYVNFCKMNSFRCRYPLNFQRKKVAGASIAGIFKHHTRCIHHRINRFSGFLIGSPEYLLAWEMSMALVFSVYGTGIFQKWKILRTDQLRDLIDRQVSWRPIHPKIREEGRGGGGGVGVGS